MAAPPQSRDSAKLERDLLTVYEKVRLCQEMLQESPGIAEDEALSEVVGFLEACRDRIIDLVEAGSMVSSCVMICFVDLMLLLSRFVLLWKALKCFGIF